jgi:predicted PurR-regulated permease PerM
MNTPASTSIWPSATRYFLAILMLLVTVVVLIFLKPIFPIIGLGFIFSFLFYGPIQKLSRLLGGRYGLTAALFFLLVIVIAVILTMGVIDRLGTALNDLGISLDPENLSLGPLQDSLPAQLVDGASQAAAWLSENLLSLVASLASLVGQIVVALFFAFLLLLNLNQSRGSLNSWLPGKLGEEIRHILKQLDKVWLGYMTAQIIYGTVLGVASYIEYALLGVPYPFVMAVITGVVSLIPSIGGILASLIVAIPCLLLGSTVFTDMSSVTFALIVTLINVVITQVSYNFIALPVVGKFVRLPVAAVLVGVLAGMSAGNIMLAFLVVPILSTLTIIGGYFLSKITGREAPTIPEDAEKSPFGFFSQLMALD